MSHPLVRPLPDFAFRNPPCSASPKPRTVYIAGPMQGKPMHNFPAFFRAALALRFAGFLPVNPAERDMAEGFDPTRSVEEQGFSLNEAFRWDLQQARECNVCLLPGWRQSLGAIAEALTSVLCGNWVFEIEPGSDGESFGLDWTEEGGVSVTFRDITRADLKAVIGLGTERGA